MPDAALELQRAAADIPLTRDAREILEQATESASQRGAEQATPADVLQAMFKRKGSLAVEAITSMGLDPKAIVAVVAEDGAAAQILPLRQLLVNANREAQVLGHYQVDSIHLLLAMLYSDSPATAGPLQKAGVTMYDLRRHLQAGSKPDFLPGESDRAQGGRAAPERNRAGDVPRAAAALKRKPLPSLRGVLSVSPVFIGLLAITVLSGVVLAARILPGFVGPLTIIFVTAGWITSLCIHEFGHALVAYLGGDRAVAASGYLTLNPLRYTNVLLSLVMPIIFLLLGGIGLPGGAVYINHSVIRSKAWDSAVSVAGPAGTLLCGLVVASPFFLPGLSSTLLERPEFYGALAFLAFIEAIALVLNLLPIPGLDGFGILRPWLPYSVQDYAVRFGQMAIIGVFIVLWFVPTVSHAFFGAVLHLTDIAGIPQVLIAYGQAHMQLR
ncbi:MAG TPA: Clp protease N-terminal domain-containing protein [Candidatus Dormibacteraeota bacterium]|nr:Clp protease N-terminal domain-containing protein [Candidatus Dormibacteraeota bacterium]